MELLDTVVMGNTVESWLIATGIALLSYVAVRHVVIPILASMLRAAQGETRHWDAILTAALKETKALPLIVVCVAMGAHALTLPATVVVWVTAAGMIAVILQVGLWASAALREWMAIKTRQHIADDPSGVMKMNLAGFTAQMALWSIVLLLGLENLGIDVTGLVAGLGIGGIAVALAAQKVLGDLLASIAIVVDKPFVLGDLIYVDDEQGSVESIGLKTTRLRSLSGEQIIVSNADLLASRIRNHGRMDERRVVLEFRVPYETPSAMLREIPGLIQEVIEGLPPDKVRFDRALLDSPGTSEFVFEAVYWVLSSDPKLHKETKQEVILSVHEALERQGVHFAYPTKLELKKPLAPGEISGGAENP